MKEFFYGMVHKDKLCKRIVVCLVAVIFMGFGLSFLIRVNLGTDPCSVMNLGICDKLGISFGNWLAIFNTILFVLVFLFGKNHIGFGTLINMFLVGYSTDFFTWVFDQVLPQNLFDTLWIRVVVMIVMLALFVVVAAIYMTVDLGTAPYDALPMILGERQSKVSFQIIRIIWDVTAAVIGFCLGSTIGIVTVLMAFALGPVIASIGPWVERRIIG